MKIREFLLAIATVLILCSCSLAQDSRPDVPQPGSSEMDWNNYVCDLWNFDYTEKNPSRIHGQYFAKKQFTLADGSRPDVTEIHSMPYGESTVVWEIDWAYKWKEAVGQACFYKAMSGAADGGVLLITQGIEDKVSVLRAKIAAKEAHLRFATVNKKGEIQRWGN